MNNTIKIDGIEYNLVLVEKKEEVKQEYKPGDWVYYTKMQEVRKVVENNTYINTTSKELYDMYGSWMTMGAINQHYNIVRMATKEEIENHLIELAKKKEYNTAKKVISVMHSLTYILTFNKLTYNHKNDILSDGVVSIYQNGKWAKIVKEKEKKFTFGGQEVILSITYNNTHLISCKNEVGTFNQLTSIILNPFQINDFGSVYSKSIMTLPNTAYITLTNNPIDKYKKLITTISIGCLVGTYTELLDIYNHLVELNKK